MFSDFFCDWQMGKKKGRVQKHATRAKSAREGSDAEESESGDLRGTSSEKQRLFDTRAELREAKQESLRLSDDIAEDDEADDDDADDDDDDTHTKDEEEELSTLHTQNADLLRSLRRHRKTGASTKLSTWKPNSMRPNNKQILIAQTPPPMPSLLVPLTSIFRTRTDPHIFNVFRNAQITLRILIICESYPFLLCLCFCSTYVLTLHILFTLASFWV
jgi:hypothetical protein